MSIDLQAYYAKLANKEALSEDDAVHLLRALATTQKAAVYLAECHAATLESLPKSASKSSRSRCVTICEIAAKALRGDASGIRYPGTVEHAIERCENAVARAYPA